MQTILRPVLLLSLGSSFDYLKAIFLLGRRICCLGGCWYIAAFLSDVLSTSDIERGSAPRSLLLVHMHTDLSALRLFGKDMHLIWPCLSEVEPAHSLLSMITDRTAGGCVCLVVPHLLF